GLRFGTPALTTRGMKESEMKEVARMITRVVENPADSELKLKICGEVEELCKRFPIYKD
ncbi:MAG: serine hydroxymethyltransferase, partial [Candidatus Micrarchaeota archaeon]